MGVPSEAERPGTGYFVQIGMIELGRGSADITTRWLRGGGNAEEHRAVVGDRSADAMAGGHAMKPEPAGVR